MDEIITALRDPFRLHIIHLRQDVPDGLHGACAHPVVMWTCRLRGSAFWSCGQSSMVPPPIPRRSRRAMAWIRPAGPSPPTRAHRPPRTRRRRTSRRQGPPARRAGYRPEGSGQGGITGRVGERARHRGHWLARTGSRRKTAALQGAGLRRYPLTRATGGHGGHRQPRHRRAPGEGRMVRAGCRVCRCRLSRFSPSDGSPRPPCPAPPAPPPCPERPPGQKNPISRTSISASWSRP